MRLSKEELKKKIKENNCDDSLSWSKLNTFVEDPYSFKLKYLDKIKEEKRNAYAFLGDIVHSSLEAFYNNEIDKKQMIEKFQQGLADQHAMKINFVKDEDKNQSIEEKYYTCILNFLNNYTKKSSKSKLEQFVGMPFDHYYMQGYIDHVYPLKVEENGKNKTYVVIEDFKTSTAYSGKAIDEKAGQLKLYAIMLSNNYNIPIENIKIGWNFLKYAQINYKQKNGKIKTSNVERNELDIKLQSKIKTVAKTMGYTEDDINNFYSIISNNLKEYKNVNILDGLPVEFTEYITIQDCFVEIPFSKQIADEFQQYVLEQIKLMDSKIEAYKITKDDKLFWVDITKENSFFFINLCGYTARYHAPLKQYLENMKSFETVVTSNKKEEVDEDFNDFMNNLFENV